MIVEEQVQDITHGSLFTGIGGIDLGFEHVGMKTIWQIENDPYAIKILEKHWPDIKRYGDITQVDFTKVKYVDVLSGGFPCQDISVAGKREGINGKQSGLWSEFYRAICEIRPRYVVVENVPGLFISGLGRVLGDLAEGGYDAEWDCIPAAAFGAPHLRYRVFIVAYSTSSEWSPRTSKGKPTRCCAMAYPPFNGRTGSGRTRRRRAGPANGGIFTSDSAGTGLQGTINKGRPPAGFCQDVADAAIRCNGEITQADKRIFTQSRWWAVEPDVGRVAHGISSRVDRLKCLGNAVVPQVAEWIGRLIVNHARN